MLFTDAPHQYFPYSWVEIVHFPNGAGDKEFTEKKIEGPVHQQIVDTLAWLKSYGWDTSLQLVDFQPLGNRIIKSQFIENQVLKKCSTDLCPNRRA